MEAALFAAAVVLLASLAATGGALLRRPRSRDADLELIATRLGLTWSAEERVLRGSHRKYRVELRAGGDFAGPVLTVFLSHPVAGLALLLGRGRVPLLLERLRAEKRTVTVASDRVEVRLGRDTPVEPTIVAAVDLARALEEALDLPWAAWARRHGGRLERSPDDLLRQLHGRVREVAVEIALLAEDEHLVVEIVARPDPPLPRGLRILRRPPGVAGGELPDPFLARMLVVSGSHLDELDEALADPEVAAAVLEAVHGQEQGTVERGAVRLRFRDPQEEPEALVQVAVAAASALGRALSAGGG